MGIQVHVRGYNRETDEAEFESMLRHDPDEDQMVMACGCSHPITAEAASILTWENVDPSLEYFLEDSAIPMRGQRPTIKSGQRWRNLKNGKLYRVSGTDIPDSTNATEGRLMVLYWIPNKETQRADLYVRDQEEFLAKFELVKNPNDLVEW